MIPGDFHLSVEVLRLIFINILTDSVYNLYAYRFAAKLEHPKQDLYEDSITEDRIPEDCRVSWKVRDINCGSDPSQICGGPLSFDIRQGLSERLVQEFLFFFFFEHVEVFVKRNDSDNGDHPSMICVNSLLLWFSRAKKDAMFLSVLRLSFGNSTH